MEKATPRILVTDDDVVIRTFLRSLLKKAGYEVSEAPDGKKAMRLCRDAPPDLVILDLIMPEQEGIETLMELRRHFPDIKVISISGGIKGNADVLLTAAKDLGASSVFKKPLCAEDILGAVEEILARKRQDKATTCR